MEAEFTAEKEKAAPLSVRGENGDGAAGMEERRFREEAPPLDREEVGLYRNVAEREYHRVDRCSNSRLKEMLKSPAHVRASIESERAETKAQRLGRLVHALVLEPESASGRFDVASRCAGQTQKEKRCSRAGKIGRIVGKGETRWFCRAHDPGEEAGPEYEGTVLKESTYDKGLEAAEAVRSSKAAARLFEGGFAELTALFRHSETDPDTGVTTELPCKARIDYLRARGGKADGSPAALVPERGVITDLKTTRDASKRSFRKQLWRRGYFRQLAFYRYALSKLGVKIEECHLVAVETKPPFGVGIYRLPETTLRAGERQLDDLLARYAACEASGWWPGYPDEPRDLSLPSWAFQKL